MALMTFFVVFKVAFVMGINTEKPQCECICDCLQCEEKVYIWNNESYQEDCETTETQNNSNSPLFEREDLMSDLRTLYALDGAISDPEFVPMFCSIYRECKKHEEEEIRILENKLKELK